MAPQVTDVVCHEDFQCDGFRVPHPAPIPEFFLRNLLHDVKEVEVVAPPQIAQCPPGFPLIPLRAHPEFLGVAGKR
jgi:hypothetical protein